MECLFFMQSNKKKQREKNPESTKYSVLCNDSNSFLMNSLDEEKRISLLFTFDQSDRPSLCHGFISSILICLAMIAFKEP